jgi:hypothetical protein
MAAGRVGALLAATIATGTVLLAASPAAASPAAASPSMTVEPDTNLVGGQTVTVTASGFTPKASLAIVECSPRALNPPPGFTQQDECDLSNDLVIRTADSSGNMSATAFRVPESGSALPFTARDPAAVCPPSPTTYCGIVVANISNVNERAILGIYFQGQTPPSNGNLGASPTTNLRQGTQVAVAGSNFTPNHSFRIEECSTDASIRHNGSACYLPGAVTVMSDKDGFFQTMLTMKTGNLGGNRNGNCPPTAAQRAAGVGCEIVAQDQSTFSNGIPIYFSPGRMTVSPPVTGRGSYVLTVSAPGFATFGSPPGCSPSIDPSRDTCTKVSGETVTLTINGAVFGTARAEPTHRGLAQVVARVQFASRGAYAIVLQGQTSGETAQATVLVR